MGENKVKSGKQILDEFFMNIADIENVDEEIANMLSGLYDNDKFTDRSIAHELRKIRQRND